MPNHETPAERYARLAAECLDVANYFPPGDDRDALLQQAETWQRLSEQYEGATPPFGSAAEQPVVQQQQQIPPDDEKKK